MKWED